MDERILVVDDEEQFLDLCKRALSDWGYRVEVAHTGAEALGKCSHVAFDLVMTDLRMPGLSGMELLRKIKKVSPDTEVVIVTGYGDIETAVEAMKESACDFVSKPLRFDTFYQVVSRALARRTLYHARYADDAGRDVRYRYDGLLGKSKAMQEVFRMIEQVSGTGSSVLLLGETGTGKELTARAVHESSQRNTGPFIPVNCGSLPENLFESELFGHVKGSFTGASTSKIGLFEAASGGTIFLDEIGCVSTHTQIKLLRVLQDKEVRRVGSTEFQKVDVRIVAATNMDLVRAMEEGALREDFYYRLSSVTIPLPPLRERVEDIPLLASHFFNLYCSRIGKPQRSLSPRALELMMKYPWPGNVRQLEHMIEQIVLFSRRTIIRPGDLPPFLKTGEDDDSPFTTDALSVMERDHIMRIMEASGHNVSQAARVLGISRQALYRKLEKHELKRVASASFAEIG